MAEKVFCSSREDLDRYIAEGFAVVSISYFVGTGSFAYGLEKGSGWSRLLGSK